MSTHFENLTGLHWFWGVGLAFVLLVWALRHRHAALARFAEPHLRRGLLPGWGPARGWVRAVLLVTALTLLAVSLLDPRWGERFVELRQRGIDVVVMLDVSRSMNARDARPSRRERAITYASDLAGALAGDRIALVTFAGSASIQCPLTVDVSAFRLALDTIEIDAGVRGGSLLGDALRRAGTAFADEVPDHKAVVLFTDGEDHDSYAIEAAAALGEAGIPIFAVGIGDSEDGARIPVRVRGQESYLTYDGQQVWSKMNETLLRDVALASGGAWIPVGTGNVDMARVYEENIMPMAQREFGVEERRRRIPRFQWFAAAALGLLLIESFLGAGRAGGRG